MSNNWSTNDILQLMENNWPEIVLPRMCLMVRFRRVQELLVAAVNDIHARHDLTSGEVAALMTLRSLSTPYAATPSDLSHAIPMTSGGLTKVLKSLERRKLVRRSISGDDARSKPIQLTAKGRRLAESIVPKLAAAEFAVISAALSARERDLLSRLLQKTLDRAERDHTET